MRPRGLRPRRPDPPTGRGYTARSPSCIPVGARELDRVRERVGGPDHRADPCRHRPAMGRRRRRPRHPDRRRAGVRRPARRARPADRRRAARARRVRRAAGPSATSTVAGAAGEIAGRRRPDDRRGRCRRARSGDGRAHRRPRPSAGSAAGTVDAASRSGSRPLVDASGDVAPRPSPSSSPAASSRAGFDPQDASTATTPRRRRRRSTS